MIVWMARTLARLWCAGEVERDAQGVDLGGAAGGVAASAEGLLVDLQEVARGPDAVGTQMGQVPPYVRCRRRRTGLGRVGVVDLGTGVAADA